MEWIGEISKCSISPWRFPLYEGVPMKGNLIAQNKTHNQLLSTNPDLHLEMYFFYFIDRLF